MHNNWCETVWEQSWRFGSGSELPATRALEDDDDFSDSTRAPGTSQSDASPSISLFYFQWRSTDPIDPNGRNQSFGERSVPS